MKSESHNFNLFNGHSQVSRALRENKNETILLLNPYDSKQTHVND